MCIMLKFELNDKEEKLYNEFCTKHMHKNVNKGAIGGHISIRFVLTSVGDGKLIKCGICGKEQDITDYDVW